MFVLKMLASFFFFIEEQFVPKFGT